MQILIAYASVTGTAQKVAEHVSTRLASASTSTTPTIKFTTVLHPLCGPTKSSDDIDLTTFDAIVIGSAIQGFKWLQQADSFVSKIASQPSASASIPIFAFSVGVPRSAPLGMRSRLLNSELEGIGGELASHFKERLKDHTLFEGNFRKEDFGKGFDGSLMRVLWFFGGRYGDFLDLAKVDEWVDKVVLPELKKGK